MKTYVEVFHNVDGESASKIFDLLSDMGLKPSYGMHDFEYIWKKEPSFQEIIKLLDKIISKLKGTGAILKFSTIP